MFFTLKESERVVKVDRKAEKVFAQKVHEVTDLLTSIDAEDSEASARNVPKCIADFIAERGMDEFLEFQKAIRAYYSVPARPATAPHGGEKLGACSPAPPKGGK